MIRGAGLFLAVVAAGLRGALVRDGGHFWGSQVFGAVWMFSATQPFQGIRVNDATITDTTYSGIMFQTDYVGGQPLKPIQDSVLTNVSISGAQKSGDQFDAKSGFGLWANELPEPGQLGDRAHNCFFRIVGSGNSRHRIKGRGGESAEAGATRLRPRSVCRAPGR